MNEERGTRFRVSVTTTYAFEATVRVPGKFAEWSTERQRRWLFDTYDCFPGNFYKIGSEEVLKISVKPVEEVLEKQAIGSKP